MLNYDHMTYTIFLLLLLLVQSSCNTIPFTDNTTNTGRVELIEVDGATRVELDTSTQSIYDHINHAMINGTNIIPGNTRYENTVDDNKSDAVTNSDYTVQQNLMTTAVFQRKHNDTDVANHTTDTATNTVINTNNNTNNTSAMPVITIPSIEPVIPPTTSSVSDITFEEYTRDMLNKLRSLDNNKPNIDITATNTDAVQHGGNIHRYSDDRFNYASSDAGSKLLSTSPGMKKAYNVLNSDDDKYMMCGCSGEKYFVIQLSEDIIVDSIIISNTEHYSSSIQQFELLGSHSYPTDSWLLLGNFTAQPIHGKQLFQLTQYNKNVSTGEHTDDANDISSLWVRYIKLNWLTYYSNEYYCTLTEFNVFGHHMLQFLNSEFEQSLDEVKQITNQLKQKNNHPSTNNYDHINPNTSIESIHTISNNNTYTYDIDNNADSITNEPGVSNSDTIVNTTIVSNNDTDKLVESTQIPLQITKQVNPASNDILHTDMDISNTAQLINTMKQHTVDDIHSIDTTQLNITSDMLNKQIIDDHILLISDEPLSSRPLSEQLARLTADAQHVQEHINVQVNNYNVDMSASHSTQNDKSTNPNTSNKKQSQNVFKALNNRLKDLEIYQALSEHYIDDLSKRLANDIHTLKLFTTTTLQKQDITLIESLLAVNNTYTYYQQNNMKLIDTVEYKLYEVNILVTAIRATLVVQILVLAVISGSWIYTHYTKPISYYIQLLYCTYKSITSQLSSDSSTIPQQYLANDAKQSILHRSRTLPYPFNIDTNKISKRAKKRQQQRLTYTSNQYELLTPPPISTHTIMSNTIKRGSSYDSSNRIDQPSHMKNSNNNSNNNVLHATQQSSDHNGMHPISSTVVPSFDMFQSNDDSQQYNTIVNNTYTDTTNNHHSIPLHANNITRMHADQSSPRNCNPITVDQHNDNIVSHNVSNVPPKKPSAHRRSLSSIFSSRSK